MLNRNAGKCCPKLSAWPCRMLKSVRRSTGLGEQAFQMPWDGPRAGMRGHPRPSSHVICLNDEICADHLVPGRGTTPQSQGAACCSTAKLWEVRKRCRLHDTSVVPISPGLVHAAASMLRRMSALGMGRRLSVATNSALVLGDNGQYRRSCSHSTGCLQSVGIDRICGCMHLCLGLFDDLHTDLVAL